MVDAVRAAMTRHAGMIARLSGGATFFVRLAGAWAPVGVRGKERFHGPIYARSHRGTGLRALDILSDRQSSASGGALARHAVLFHVHRGCARRPATGARPHDGADLGRSREATERWLAP